MGVANSFKPFEDRKFLHYLLYALTFEYEPFDSVSFEILEKAAYILEGLMFTNNSTALTILHEYKIASVFSKLLKKYFLSSESPLRLADLISSKNVE